VRVEGRRIGLVGDFGLGLTNPVSALALEIGFLAGSPDGTVLPFVDEVGSVASLWDISPGDFLIRGPLVAVLESCPATVVAP
jgi:hypothetical protein